ncbi:Molybdopterin molybdenumtransferase [Candidatus Electronema halotolerans]
MKPAALSLAQACAVLADHLSPLPPERVPLTKALGRVSAAAICAARPSPAFSQSTRDGFAVAAQPLAVDQGAAVFQVIGEMAAGCGEQKALAPGQAVRIMTGALLPSNAVRVIPFEVCQENDKTVQVPLAELENRQLHIRCQGQDIQAGQVLAAAGTRLLPDHLRWLAENGSEEITAHRLPRVAVLCTGSELVSAGETLQHGQKISSNGVLLTALLEEQHCTCVRSVTAADKAEPTAALICAIIAQDQPDLLISTGGMGPGKFDLTEQVFARLGGKLFCNRLRLRPGKATLLGMLGKRPFLGLPGPPPAVRLLFHELVAPALRQLAGEAASDRLLEAVLDQPLPVRQKDRAELVLKGGRAWLDAAGCLRVRPAATLEPVNAIMHLSGNRSERVQVRLVGPLAA